MNQSCLVVQYYGKFWREKTYARAFFGASAFAESWYSSVIGQLCANTWPFHLHWQEPVLTVQMVSAHLYPNFFYGFSAKEFIPNKRCYLIVSPLIAYGYERRRTEYGRYISIHKSSAALLVLFSGFSHEARRSRSTGMGIKTVQAVFPWARGNGGGGVACTRRRQSIRTLTGTGPRMNLM